ncbi:MAG: hypothetical protein Q9226_003898 [Calogaya cf. arnoldii]
MIPVISNHCKPNGFSQSRLHGSTLSYTWTEQRLDDALASFLKNKPPSMRVCIFIDGLDEFVGDEDRLIDTIRTLSHASGTKVCASSRPEQIFRQGFSTSPQLKLQDFNYKDIRKATIEQLIPTLKAHVSCAQYEHDDLVHRLLGKSQGIFLWADLMTKDLKRGARNADSIEELKERLERIPETIDGLYEHMLSRLDKAYLRDTRKYFHHLQIYEEASDVDFDFTHSCSLPPNLLGFACIEEGGLSQQLHKSPGFLQSSLAQDCCRRVETRILTRCAGLVEVEEHVSHHYLPYLSSVPSSSTLRESGRIKLAEEGIAGFIRRVKFIHKTAADFTRNHDDFFGDSDCRSAARFSALRSQIAVARLAPLFVSQPKSSSQNEGPIIVKYDFVRNLMLESSPEVGCCQATQDTCIQIVDEIYDVLCYLRTAFDSPAYTTFDYANSGLYSKNDEMDVVNPFGYRLGFATFFGRHDYVTRYMVSNSFPQHDVEYILKCAILGLEMWFPLLKDGSTDRGLLNILLEYSPLSADPYIKPRESPELPSMVRKSKWSAFATRSFRMIDSIFWYGTMEYHQEFLVARNPLIDVIKKFYVHDAKADPNILVKSEAMVSPSKYPPFCNKYLRLVFEETTATYMERIKAAAFRDSAEAVTPLGELEGLLRAHGGTSYRKVCAVVSELHTVRLTDDQSDRLLDAIPLECMSPVVSSPEYSLAAPAQSDFAKAEEVVAGIETDLCRYGNNPLVTTDRPNNV